MILATWNINGLRSYQKKYDLKEFLENYNIDVLNLQETKLVEGWNIQEEIHLPHDWNIYQNIATSRKGYAGVASISNWLVFGDFNMAHQELDLARPKQNRNNNMFTAEELGSDHCPVLVEIDM